MLETQEQFPVRRGDALPLYRSTDLPIVISFPSASLLLPQQL
jgi:hypothetical protein